MAEINPDIEALKRIRKGIFWCHSSTVPMIALVEIITAIIGDKEDWMKKRGRDVHGYGKVISPRKMIGYKIVDGEWQYFEEEA